MDDRRRDGPERDERGCGGDEGRRDEGRGRDERRGGPSGPPDSAFLQLEMSKVLYGEAEALTRVAAREILKDAIKDRLRERLGARLEAIAKIAADELADDIEASLAIEAAIEKRKQSRGTRDAALRDAFATSETPDAKDD